MTTTDHRAEAEWLTRMGRWGSYALTTVAVLALVFTMVNVQQFAAAGHPVGSFQWFIAWLLDPMASITLGTAIVWRSVLADHNRNEPWLNATMWYAGIATYVMNTWASWAAGSPSGVVLHSVAPGLILLLAESAPRVRRHFGDIRADLATQADTEDADSALTAALAEFQDLVDRTAGDADQDAVVGDFPRVGGDPTPPQDRTDHAPSPVPVVVPSPHTPTPVGTRDWPQRVGDITEADIQDARKVRNNLTEAGRPAGRPALMTELGVTERVAKALVAATNTNPTAPVRAVSGTR
jgi:hypothetical protein